MRKHICLHVEKEKIILFFYKCYAQNKLLEKHSVKLSLIKMAIGAMAEDKYLN